MKSSRGTKRKKSCYHCLHCNVSFSTLQSLQNHAQNLSPHPECLSSLVKCPYCPRYFVTQQSLLHHLRRSDTCNYHQNSQQNVNTIDLTSSQNNIEISEKSVDDAMVLESIDKNPSELLTISVEQSMPTNGPKKYLSKTSSNIPKPVFDHDPMKDSQNYILNLQNIRTKLETYEKNGTFEKSKLKRLQFFLDLTLFIIGSTENSESSENLETTFRNFYLSSNNQYYELSLLAEFPIISRPSSDYIITIHDAFEFFNEFKDVPNHYESVDESYDESDNDMDMFEQDDDDPIDQLYDTSLLNSAKDASEYRDNHQFVPMDHAMLDLHEILRPISAPIYIFDQLTEWAQKHQESFGVIGTTIPSRESFIKSISTRIYGKKLSDDLKPSVRTIEIPEPKRKSKRKKNDNDNDSKKTVKVTKFSLRASLASLMCNKELMTDENLLLDPNDPFSLPPKSDVLDDLNTGWWHRETHKEICTSPNNILLPVVFFIDSGKVTERMSIEPIVFTLGLFKRRIRNLPNSWRTLGYIENLHNSIGDDDKNYTTDYSHHSYHVILKEILEDLKSLQGKDGGFIWDLNLGGKNHRVVFKIAVQVIIGDCVGLDKLCLHKGSSHDKAKCLCRDCNVSPEDSENPQHICQFTRRSDVENKSDDELQEISKKSISNAFSDVYFGARNLSIFECTPPEPLHQMLLGLVKYLANEFFEVITLSMKKKISLCVKHIYKNCSRQSSRNFPSLASIQNCVSNPGTLSASEQYSRLFAIFIAMNIPGIFEYIATTKRKVRNVDRKTDDEPLFIDVDMLGINGTRQWMLLIEHTLCFYQWLMEPCHKLNDIEHTTLDDGTIIESRGMTRLRRYLQNYHDLMKDRSGRGCKINKFHQTLHYIVQILKDGSVLNIDTGRPESNAVSMYKNLSTTTQLRQKSLNTQVARRHYEDMMLQEACLLTKRERSVNSSSSATNVISCLGSKYELKLCIEQDGGSRTRRARCTMKWSTSSSQGTFDPVILSAITKRLFLSTNIYGGCLTYDSTPIGYTEYRPPNTDTIFRAHPSFRGEKQWFDWCTLRWDNIDDPIPARIITFLDLSRCKFMTHIQIRELNMSEVNVSNNIMTNHDPFLESGMWVVVQSAHTFDESRQLTQNDEDYNEYSFDGNIVQRLVLEDTYRILPVETIESPCYCVPQYSNMDIPHNNEERNRFLYFHDIKEWGDVFIKSEDDDW